MMTSILKRLLIRYEEGKATAVERFLVDSWFDSIRDEQATRKELDQTLGDALFSRVIKTISAQDRRVRMLRTRTWITAAASILILFFTWMWYMNSRQETISYVQISSTFGEVKRHQLPDSSVLWLNSNSSIRYPKDFVANDRAVEILDGEVYFKVAKYRGLPFSVQTATSKVSVLGTEFLVSAYAELKQQSVGVSSGLVKVQMPDQVYAALAAGDAVSWDSHTHKSVKEKVHHYGFDPNTQQILLQEASFDELALRLYNAYGYRLVAADAAVEERKFTGSFTPREDMKAVLNRLSWIYEGTYQIQGKEVLMK